MRFHEDSVASRLRPAAFAKIRRSCVDRRRCGRPASAWHLYAVGGVKDHGATQILHERDRTHVADEIAVARRSRTAAQGQQQFAIAPTSSILRTTFFMSQRP